MEINNFLWCFELLFIESGLCSKSAKTALFVIDITRIAYIIFFLNSHSLVGGFFLNKHAPCFAI